MPSKVSTYISAIKTLLEPIVFDNTTLAKANIIKTYQKSIATKPNTEINIFAAPLVSRFLEARLNRRERDIVVRIRCKAAGDRNEPREQQAQEDIQYLEEQIMSKLEDALKNSSWGDGFLRTDELAFRDRNYQDNYYTKEITLTVNKWETVTV